MSASPPSEAAGPPPPRLSPPIWLMGLAAFTVGCGMRVLDPLLPMLAREFGVGLGAVAPLIAGFALAYGLGQLFAGPIGDGFGKLRVAAVAMRRPRLDAVAAPVMAALCGRLGESIWLAVHEPERGRAIYLHEQAPERLLRVQAPIKPIPVALTGEGLP